jgi:hypothetical protein
MRNSENSHQVSWDAAYAVVKRQGDRLFRTSPQHAAVLITEAVVDVLLFASEMKPKI